MPARSLRRSAPVVVALAVLMAACSVGGPGGPPPTGLPSAASVATATPAASPTAASSTAQPPAASLAVEGGDPVTAQLGSFTWNGGGSDSPWLPGSPITIGQGERMTVSFTTDPGVASWTARRAAAETLDGAGAVGLGQGATPITFSPPPPGTWSVQLTVQFANRRGSAAYYWQVTVH